MMLKNISFHLVACFCVAHLYAMMDLFVSVEENQKQLGISAETYYIRDGQPVEYALGFVIPVKANTSTMAFFWRAKGGSHSKVRYSLNVLYDVNEAIGRWTSNVSTMGYVPPKMQGFSITLPCTGKSSAEIDVVIQLNATSGDAPLNVSLRRKKICLQRILDATIHQDPLNFTNLSDEDRLFRAIQTRPSSLTDGRKVLIIGTIVTFVSLLFIVVIGIIKFRARKKPTGVDEVGAREQSVPLHRLEETENVYTSSPKESLIGTQYYEEAYSVIHPPSLLVPPHRSPQDIGLYEPALKALDMNPKLISVGDVIASGTFGEVRRGFFVPENGQDPAEVLIKTVKFGSTPSQKNVLLMEGLMLYGISHENISELLGCVNVEPPMVIFAGSLQENLKEFFSTPNKVRSLGILDLVKMGVDVLNGLTFLHWKKIVHKDIAARNCLISSNLKVQIADNALARDLFPNDYHCLGDNKNRPVKWMAFESLLFEQFYPASDVWSFGVLLWEIMSLGQHPYYEIDAFQMHEVLKEGFRLLKPSNCPDDLYKVMTRCWPLAPDIRPTAAELHRYLVDFHDKLIDYV